VEKGQQAERVGKLDSAREHFLRAMLHRAAVGQEWVGQCEFQLANIQAERGDAASAVDLYKSSFDTWPELRECCDAHNNLGLALEECDRANEALEAYSAAISCEPWRCEPRGNLANILWEFGALEAAERELRTALELADVGPFKVKLLFNLETLLGEYEAKRADEAAAVHDLAVQLSPPELKTADAWHERDRVGTDDEQCVLFSTETTRCMEDEGL
jgi:tetratricopeptide (TPR) repeat protein